MCIRDSIKTVKRKITDLDAMKIQEQKRAVRSGYDMDILPSDLATYGQDAKELLKTLQSRNERMFQITFLVLNTADTRQKLENEIFWASGVAQKYNNSLVRLDYQQEQGLMSSLPLGASHIRIERSLTTSTVAVFVPFVTQELFQGGNAMYYGINAKTGNMIMPVSYTHLEIVDLILETVCTRRKTIRVAGDDYPAELVKSKFMKLDSEHIRFVLDCLNRNTTEIRNIKKYLLAALFNAPSTIGNYYSSLVAHDMATGKI